jgi:hypothetical protein
MKKLIKRIFRKVQIHASLTDIKGNKSGGKRDSSRVDWYSDDNGILTIN